MKRAICVMLLAALCCTLAACGTQGTQLSSGGRVDVVETATEAPLPQPAETGEKASGGGTEETTEPQETLAPQPTLNPVSQEEEPNVVVYEGEGLTVTLRRFTFAADNEAVFTYDVVSNASQELTCTLRLNSANCFSLASQTSAYAEEEPYLDTQTISPGTSTAWEVHYCLQDPGIGRMAMTQFDHFSVNTQVTCITAEGWTKTLADTVTYVEVTGAAEPDYLNPAGDTLYTDDLLTVTSLGYEAETGLLYVYMGFRNEGKDDTVCVYPAVNVATWQSKFSLHEEYDVRVNCCKMALFAFDVKPMLAQLGLEQPSSLELAINFYGQKWQPVTLSVPIGTDSAAPAFPWEKNPLGMTDDLFFYYDQRIQQEGDCDLISFAVCNCTATEFLISLKDGALTIGGKTYSAWGAAVLRPGMTTVFTVAVHEQDGTPVSGLTGEASFIFDYSPQVAGTDYYSGARYSDTLTCTIG